MPEKQQKQIGKDLNKNSNRKDNKKNQKKSSLNKMNQFELQELQTQKIKEFFNLELRKINHKINTSVIDQSVTQDIVTGHIKVPQQPRYISTLIKPQQQAVQKITPQEMEKYEKEARRIQHLKLIANLNKQLTNKQPQESIPYILTKQQHQRKIRQIVEEKKTREKKMLQIRDSLKLKFQNQEKVAQQKTKQEKSQEKQKKRIEIEQKITKQKEEHIHFLSSDIKHRKDLEDVLHKVPLHVKMEEKFKVSIQMPELQQKKKLYKELRDFKHKYSLDHIRQHEKDFDQRQKSRLQLSKMKKTASLSTIEVLKFPEKSQHLKSILAEEMHNIKRQWSQKDLKIEEKLKRQQNYLKKLKEQHKPKIDKAKQKQIEKRLIKQKQHLSKVGLQIDERKVGLEYLDQVKKMVRKRKQTGSEENQEFQALRHQHKSQILLPSTKKSSGPQNRFDINRNSDAILRLRDKKLSKIINSEEEPDKKLKMLEIQTKKIEQVKKLKLGFLKHNFNEIASKQASNLALNSIKAKMNLIELMKNQ